MKYGSEIHIHNSVEALWTFVSNPDKNSRWLSHYQSFEPISGEQGQPGAKARHRYERHGRKVEFVEEVLKRTHLSHMKSRFTHDVMDLEVDYFFESQGDQKSRLTVEVQVKFTTLLFKIIGPFMKRAFSSRQRSDLKRLRQAVESLGVAVPND